MTERLGVLYNIDCFEDLQGVKGSQWTLESHAVLTAF